MELRPYQQQMIDTLMADMTTERFLLVQAATGAGKTIIFSALVKRLMEQWPKMRIMIVAHRETLIHQTRDKMIQVWPEGAEKIGLACASASKCVNLDAPLVIGSIQTVARRLEQMGAFDMLIIDECHRVPPMADGTGDSEADSQYARLLAALETKYPSVRVLGVTATPYRLGHGYIYGDGEWWPQVNAAAGIETLQTQHFLCDLRTKVRLGPKSQLEQIERAKKLPGGDFIEGQLGDLLSQDVFLQAAIEAYDDYGEKRQHVVAFCVTISHAECLAAAFIGHGIPAVTVHSKMTREERQAAMTQFESGAAVVLCNVGVLTEGWDCPMVDCILMCRPTMSAALYVQMVGRGLRLFEGKQDCLLLDCVDNYGRHGDVRHPRVSGETATGDAPEKECPQCHEIVPLGTMICPHCGHEFVGQEHEVEEAEPIEMIEVKYMTPAEKHAQPPFMARVRTWSAKIQDFYSKNGNHFMRIVLPCDDIGTSRLTFGKPKYWASRLLSFGSGKTSKFYHDIEENSIADWNTLAGTSLPESIEEAYWRRDEISIPQHVMLGYDKQGWCEVRSWEA